MDILAQKRMLFVLIFSTLLFVDSPASAVFESYGFSHIDYFDANLTGNEPHDLFSTDDLWNETHDSSEGATEIYRPPKVVVQFLEQPNEENARKYIQWNTLRMDKIIRAQKILEQISSNVR